MSTNLLISIVVPCYNQSRTLGETLDSVFAQRYSNWECIIVDDGSTDATSEIAARYTSRDARFVYCHTANSGLPSARNEGIRLSRGSFINFLDSDDVLREDMLSSGAAVLDKYPETDLIFSGWAYAHESLTKIRKVTLPAYDATRDNFFRTMCMGNLFPVHAAIVRMSVVHNTAMFDARLKSCEDWDFWLQVGRLTNRVHTIARPLVVYRLVKGSMTRNVDVFFKAGLEVLARTAVSDERIENPIPESANGYNGHLNQAKKHWRKRNAGLYIAQGNSASAAALLRALPDGSLDMNDFVDIWKSVLFGAVYSLDERSTAWKKYRETFEKFVSAIELSSAAGPGPGAIMRRLRFFNASRPVKLFLKLTLRDR